MKKYVKTQFNADLKNVIFSRGIVASFFLDEAVNLNIVNEIKTIVSEAVTNAIVHGYQNNPDGVVSLDLEYENNAIKIVVNDNGIGISDINKAREPLFSSRPSEERAGLGFTIMEVFSDSLDIISKPNEGTSLVINKYIS